MTDYQCTCYNTEDADFGFRYRQMTGCILHDPKLMEMRLVKIERELKSQRMLIEDIITKPWWKLSGDQLGALAAIIGIIAALFIVSFFA